MPGIEVEIELYCARCGAGICSNGTARRQGRAPAFDIEPCEKCLSDENDVGYDKGYDKGLEDA